jgi:hypothetical protein
VAAEAIVGWIVRGLGRAAVHDGDLVAAALRRADDPVTDEAGSPEHEQAHATITARLHGTAGRDLPTADRDGGAASSRGLPGSHHHSDLRQPQKLALANLIGKSSLRPPPKTGKPGIDATID